MSRRQDKGRLPQFVPLFHTTLDAPAWRAMSHGARSLYVALKRRYSGRTSSAVFLSQRMAANELGSHHNEVCRWFRELEFYGFIANISRGCLGVDGKGKAPHWRLTEVPYHDAPATRDFLKWDGSKFKPKKTESRAGNGARGVPEMAHTTVPESRPVQAESVPEIPHIQSASTVPEMAHITSKPLPSAEASALQPSPNLIAILTRPRGAPAKRAIQSAVASGRAQGSDLDWPDLPACLDRRVAAR